MKYQLQLLSGPGDKSIREFEKASIQLGRGEWNDLVFNDVSHRMVSRNHAEIQVRGHQFSIKDLQSSFGTYVNGKKIEQCALQANDVIQLGTNGPEVKITWTVPAFPSADANRTMMVDSMSDAGQTMVVGMEEPGGKTSVAPAAKVAGGVTSLAPPPMKATVVVGSAGAMPPPAAAKAGPGGAPQATVVFSESGAPAAPPPGGAKPKATVVMDPAMDASRRPPSSIPPSTPKPAGPPKQGIGKETMAVIVDEAIRKEREKIKAEAGTSGTQAAQASVGGLKRIVTVGGGALALLLLVAFILFYRDWKQKQDMEEQLSKQSQQIAELLTLNANAQQVAEDKQKQLQAELQKVLAQKDEEARQKEAAIRAEINEEKKKVAALQALSDKIKTDSKSTQAANQQLAASGEGSAVLILCRYSIGEISNDAVGSGFFVSSDGRVVTAKQVVEPWKFDPAILHYMKLSGVNSNQVQREIYLWKKDARVNQAGQPNLSSALSTTSGSLSIVKLAGDEMENQSYQPEDGGAKESIRVHRSASENNLALLQVRGGGVSPVRLESANPEKGTSVASFGYPVGVEQPVAKPEIFRAGLASGGSQMSLDKATAPGFLGAALLNSGGNVVGMIVDQQYVVPVTAIQKLIR